MDIDFQYKQDSENEINEDYTVLSSYTIPSSSEINNSERKSSSSGEQESV